MILISYPENVFFLKTAPIIVIDANLTLGAMETILMFATRWNKPVFYEPTDLLIADKPFKLPSNLSKQIKFLSPNLNELRTIYKSLKLPKINETEPNDDLSKIIEEVQNLCLGVRDYVENIIVTLGRHGVFVMSRFGRDENFFDDNHRLKACSGKFQGFYYYAPVIVEVSNASGAGDAFCAGFITGMLKQFPQHICVKLGFKASLYAVKADGAVPKIYFDVKEFCTNAIKEGQSN